MGIANRIDKTLGLSVVVWAGTVTREQWRGYVTRMAPQLDDYLGCRVFLVHATNAIDVSEMDPAVFEETMTEYPRAFEAMAGARLAFVPGPLWALAKQYEDILKSRGVHPVTFTEWRTACAFLGLDPDLIGPMIDELRTEIHERDAAEIGA